jgi:hypothetical protein
MRKSVLRIFHRSLLGLSSQGAEIGGTCSKHGKEEKLTSFWSGGKGSLSRPVDLRETECGDMDWVCVVLNG